MYIETLGNMSFETTQVIESMRTTLSVARKSISVANPPKLTTHRPCAPSNQTQMIPSSQSSSFPPNLQLSFKSIYRSINGSSTTFC
jgi:hypothetical protein